MITFMERQRPTLTHKFICGFVAFTFIFTCVVPPQAKAQMASQGYLSLPEPGMMLPVSEGFAPTLIKGVTIHPENPLAFNFIVDRGDTTLAGQELNAEAKKLVRYFLATITTPEDQTWVNLSPNEPDRIIPEAFGQTEMGRDLLAQDYILKQLTASMMYPENEFGEQFWTRVYEKAQEQFGTTNIPMDSFNKVWIVPEKAKVYVHDNSAFVVNCTLKVMLETDYLAMKMEKGEEKGEKDLLSPVSLQSSLIREILIPEIEREVNEGENFANLRQIYNSMVLATWYKKNLKDSLLGKVYMDQNKVKGVDHNQEGVNKEIYHQYLEAFEKGVYNYIREDYDPAQQEIIPRKYFSGGLTYTYSVAKGSASSETEQYPGTEESTKLYFLEFDKTHVFNATGTYKIPKDEGPELFDEKILENSDYSLIFRASSGYPYTPTGRDIGFVEKNSLRRPSNYTIDFEFGRTFTFDPDVSLRFFIEVLNLTDHRNVAWVYPDTGDPDFTYVGGYSTEYMRDPSNYGPPRSIRIGLGLRY